MAASRTISTLRLWQTENVAILGRRGDDFAKEQQRRTALPRFTGNNIEILSYDWLLDLVDENRADR